jgi:hypothetical protein
MEKTSWTGRVRTEEVLHTVKDERNILHTNKKINKQLDWSHYAYE